MYRVYSQGFCKVVASEAVRAAEAGEVLLSDGS